MTIKSTKIILSNQYICLFCRARQIMQEFLKYNFTFTYHQTINLPSRSHETMTFNNPEVDGAWSCILKLYARHSEGGWASRRRMFTINSIYWSFRVRESQHVSQGWCTLWSNDGTLQHDLTNFHVNGEFDLMNNLRYRLGFNDYFDWILDTQISNSDT